MGQRGFSSKVHGARPLSSLVLTCHDTSGYTAPTMAMVKFSSKIESSVLKELRSFAQESKRSISDLLTEAVSSHLQDIRVRPAFRRAMTEVLDENDELLKRLAR